MNLFNTFIEIETPETNHRNVFNALSVQGYSFAKIARNNEDFPVLLISSQTDRTNYSYKNIKLKYIELKHNQECKIYENDKIKYQDFTIILLKSTDENLQKYFLGIAETLIKSLSQKPTSTEVYKLFKNFVEIFRALSDVPSKTIQGLWAELFIIDYSRNSSLLLDYWHNIPEERYDFNAGMEKIEVKSNSKLERIHIFTSEQLNPQTGQVLVASIFTKQISKGKSINDLTQSILSKINSSELEEKLFSIIAKTLGNSLEQGINIKFDYELAKNSLKYYKHQDIEKIEKIYIPSKVSEVKFKSDLTELSPISKEEVKEFNIGLFENLLIE